MNAKKAWLRASHAARSNMRAFRSLFSDSNTPTCYPAPSLAHLHPCMLKIFGCVERRTGIHGLVEAALRASKKETEKPRPPLVCVGGKLRLFKEPKLIID